MQLTPDIRPATSHDKSPIVERDVNATLAAQLEVAASTQPVPPAVCLSLARLYLRLGNVEEAIRWSVSVVGSGNDFPSWTAAAALIEKATGWKTSNPRRRARVALLGSFTTSQLAKILPLACLRHGIELHIWEAPYDQYRQEILNPESSLYTQHPDFIIIAVHERDLTLPWISEEPDIEVARELARWTNLWDAVSLKTSARVIQFNFALSAEDPIGHLGARLPGSRYAMVQALNAHLGKAAGTNVLLLDAERISAWIGKERWIDPRYWHMSKQAISFQALPLVCRHLTALLAADLGLSRKCLVLDLDNTLWGGIIGEDGISGIQLGGDQTGEAFVAFQEYISQLKRKGVILAVCSKNNEADAKEPFERHSEMRLKLDDFAVFVANWEPKADNLKHIAKSLNIGLDSIVFVDDNPAECLAVRSALPEVDVIPLPQDPSYYVRTLSQYGMFETTALTAEDAQRSAQYYARSEAARLQQSASSLEDFWTSLEMKATISGFDELNLPRIVQLIGKTNQFNLTARRHNQAQVETMMRDTGCVHFYLRLSDRFADHGLVSLLIGVQKGDVLEIDTWLMSCRVIGRTVEKTMLAYLSAQAASRGIRTLRGVYLPTLKNELVKDLYPQLGFKPVEVAEGQGWEYNLTDDGVPQNPFIQITTTT